MTPEEITAVDQPAPDNVSEQIDTETPVTKAQVAKAMNGIDPDDDGEDDNPTVKPAVKPTTKPAEVKPEEVASKAAEPVVEQVKPAEKLLSQSEVNQIVQSRLAQEKAQHEKAIFAATGKTLEQLKAETHEKRVEDLQFNRNLDEETAREIADKEARLRDLEEREKETVQERELIKATRAYQEDRSTFLSTSKHPKVKALVEQFTGEIDEFSGQGSAVAFEGAVTWLLGQKALSGELFDQLDRAAEQRTLANVDQRSKVKPETTNGAPNNKVELTAAQKATAKAMGVPEDRYAAQLARIKTQPRRGR